MGPLLLEGENEGYSFFIENEKYRTEKWRLPGRQTLRVD